MGEFSVGKFWRRRVIAPGHAETVRPLRLRPSTPRELLQHRITHHVPERSFELDEKVRSKPPIIKGEEQGVDIEHLRPLLNN